MQSKSELALSETRRDRVNELLDERLVHTASMKKVMDEMRHLRRDLKLLGEAYSTARADLQRALGWIDCSMNVPPGTQPQQGVNYDDG